MKKSTTKLLSVLCVAFFILSIAVPAFAASENSVDRVLTVEKDDEFTVQSAPTLTIEEKKVGDYKDGDYFELVLTNAEWKTDDITLGSAVVVENATGSAITYKSKKILGIEIGAITPSEKVKIKVKMVTKITEDGEAKVTVSRRDSAVTEGTYVFAVAAKGKTIATIDKVKKFAGRKVTLEPVRIDETSIGALDNSGTITLKLPPKYYWPEDGMKNYPGTSDITYSGGISSANFALDSSVDLDGRTLKLNYDTLSRSSSARGSVFFNNLVVMADRDAPYGDVVLDIDGDVTAEELVVAKRLDYDVEITVKEVKELIAGRKDEKTAEIKIKQNIDGSLIPNREIEVVLPKWVKINRVVEVSPSGLEKDIDKNELYLNVGSILESEYKFKLELSIEADEAGDIVAEFSGAGLEEQEVVIAKAVAPITADVAAVDLKIGMQNQVAPDITITESKKGAIDSKDLTITLPKGIKFASTPEVEVTEGNLEVGKVNVEDDNKVVIEVKSTSTKPSTIKISDIKLTLDRTVPEGEFKASIGGDALVKNYKDSNNKEEWRFDKDNVVKFVFANVITPAPGETRATSVFTIGGTTYTVMEQNTTVEKTMDVAPYIKTGRTFLPLRYVANALGVNDDNIIWDPVTKAVTIFKGDRIAQVTIGSKTMLVNGVTVNMDVAPEITDERTMLPIRWMGQALGATIDWDAETRSVTVKQ